MNIWDRLHSKASLPLLMGIVNVTPDSFSDGGQWFNVDMAVEHSLKLIEDGADIIDVGGESTRPPGKSYGSGSVSISIEEELSRVIPVIEGVRRINPDIAISVDTMKPQVARQAIESGANIINDVGGGRFDPDIIRVAATYDVPLVVMHGHDPHNRMQVETYAYGNVVREVYTFLDQTIKSMRERGVNKIIADVGIGFAKGTIDSMTLLKNHSAFLSLGVPLMVGASRKAFIGEMLGGLAPDERLFGTLGVNASAAAQGTSILRLHDVKPAHQFFKLFRATLGDNSPCSQ